MVEQTTNKKTNIAISGAMPPCPKNNQKQAVLVFQKYPFLFHMKFSHLAYLSNWSLYILLCIYIYILYTFLNYKMYKIR